MYKPLYGVYLHLLVLKKESYREVVPFLKYYHLRSCICLFLCVCLCVCVCSCVRVCEQLPSNLCFDRQISAHEKSGGVKG